MFIFIIPLLSFFTQKPFKEKEMFEALYHRTAKVLEKEIPLNSIVKVNIRQIFLYVGFVRKLWHV